MENKQIKAITFTALLAITYLSGCEQSMSYDEYIVAAKSQIEKGDNTSAILSLKNAVRMQPENLEARYELGSVYLSEGDLFSAEKELDKALKLGANNQELLPKIAKVKMLLNKYDAVYQLADNAGAYNDEQYVMILTYAGLSAISEDKIRIAQDYIGQASMLSEDSLYSQVGNAWLNFSSEKFDDVAETLDKILVESEGFSEALLLSGHLHQAQFEFKKAIEMYSAYLKLHPRHFQVKLYLINSLLGAQDFDSAEQHLALLNQLYKDHPIVNLYNAQIQYNHKEYAEAKVFAEKAIQANSSLHMGNLIAGMSAFKLNELELAYRYLNKVNQYLPKDHDVKKLLAILQLQLGFIDDAELSFENMNASSLNDMSILNAASRAFAEKGQGDVAEKLLNKVVKANPDNSNLALQYSALKLSNGDTSQLSLLEQLAQGDDESVGAILILATHYINQKDYENAFKLAEKLKAKKGDEIRGALLEGFIYVNKQDKGTAQQVFKKILTEDEGNVPANYYLGEFAFDKSDWESAKTYFNTILRFEPTHKASVARLTYINVQLNKVDETIDYLEVLLAKYPKNEDVIIDLSMNLSFANKHKEAIELLENSNVELKSDRYLRRLAKLYVVDSQFQNALDLYKTLTIKQPLEQSLWLEYATVKEKIGSLESALTTVNEGLNQSSSKEQLLLLKANLLITLGRNESAEKIVDELSNKFPNNKYVVYLKAQLNLAKKEVNNASEQFSLLYENSPSNDLALNWARSLVKQDHLDQAINVLERHEKVYSLNDANKALLAELLLNKNTSKSIMLYKNLKEKYPKNIAVLNNLSLALYNQSKFEEALPYAQTAYQTVKSSVTIDTLVQLLIANNQSQSAIELITNNDNQSFINNALKLSLSELYLSHGQKNDAKAVLNGMSNISEELKERFNKLLNKI